jgi:hypothetical protein
LKRQSAGFSFTPKLWMHPSHDFSRNLAAFDADLDAPFPFMYISLPSAKDPSFGARYPKKRLAERLWLDLYRHVPAASGTVTTWELSPPSPRNTSLTLHVVNRTVLAQDIGTVGVAGALSGAMVTASAMSRRNMFGAVSKAARTAASQNRAGRVP